MSEQRQEPDFWLATVKERSQYGYVTELELSDGPHSSMEGVVQAARLSRRIFGDRFGPYVAVMVTEVPDVEVEINEEAADTCKRLVDGTL